MPEKVRKPVRRGRREGERRALLLVRCEMSPWQSGAGFEVIEASDGVGDGPSAVGTLRGCNVVAMLRGRDDVGVVGFGGRRRYQTGVSNGSRLGVVVLLFE